MTLYSQLNAGEWAAGQKQDTSTDGGSHGSHNRETPRRLIEAILPFHSLSDTIAML